ncbi:sulfatase-like hydrolase/transferase [Haloarchaeobius sp. TZWSO28]|uniref:sulfatase-like hydrolase/transferase n=1 Tax=Haloarchaeobius sp. TZWSO28 TaxID=3446119 RepID=UPI003EBCC6E2
MDRNLVVVCLDTVRKDFFDRYATRLRANADVSFEQCRAASCWSVPSHASMLTGRLPSEHGATAASPQFDALDPGGTLRADLPDHHFLGVSSNIYAGSAYGFDHLFDEFVDVTRDHRYPDALDVPTYTKTATEPGLSRYLAVLRACVGHDRPVRSLANAAAAQVDQLWDTGPFDFPAPFDDGAVSARRATVERVREHDEPVFAFVNLMEGHEPHRDTLRYDRDLYDVPRGWRSDDLQTWDAVNPDDETTRELQHYRDVYGASIEYLDRQVSRFVDEVQAATDRETTVVVTADHGENLAFDADDGHLGHITSLTEGVLHVPLLVFNAPDGVGMDDGSTRVETGYVSHLELPRLLAGLAAGELPDVTAERIPAEVLAITPGNDPLEAADPEYWTRRLRVVYEGDTKYEWDSLGGEYAVSLDPADPCWQSREVLGDGTVDEGDASTAIPSWAREQFPVALDDVALTAPAGDDDGDGVSDDVKDRLADLGYR